MALGTRSAPNPDAIPLRGEVVVDILRAAVAMGVAHHAADQTPVYHVTVQNPEPVPGPTAASAVRRCLCERPAKRVWRNQQSPGAPTRTQSRMTR